MPKTTTAKSTARFVARTSAFVACVVIVTLLTALNFVLSTTDHVNSDAAMQSHARFRQAIDGELGIVKAEIAMIASGRSARDYESIPKSDDEINDEVLHHLWSYFGFGSAYIIDAYGVVVSGQEQGLAASQTEFNAIKTLLSPLIDQAVESDLILTRMNRPRLLSPGNEMELGVSMLMHDGQRVVAAVAVPLARKPEAKSNSLKLPLLAVGLKELRPNELQNLAKRQGLVRFDIVRDIAHQSGNSIALSDGANNVQAYLQWHPDRPGDLMFRNTALILTLSVIFIVAMLIWIFSGLRNVAVEIAKREDMIDKIAAFDELSGLHNRRGFEALHGEHFARATRIGGALALLMLDLDKFKPVNDIHGHLVGDEVIKAVATRLREQIRAGDSVARLGGDEFAIIQTQMALPSDAAQLGQRILDALNKPFDINGIEVSIGVSIGIAVMSRDVSDKETLVHMADTALYRAKSEGRNRICFFESGMENSERLNRIVAEDLRYAIDHEQLVLHYQPQMSADGTTVSGVEALVRWQHPVHGMIPPIDFIAIAEQRGLIVPLSQWVLRRACLDAKRWPDIRLAVNVSAIDFRNPEFVGNVGKILAETGFEPSRLELELTEGVVVEDADAAERAMMELRGLGVSLALDDFGTGYSSLIYLRRFAFDKIKIDRSFLEYMETTGESAILVHSVVHLGRALGLRVCAEGVETAEQHRFLQAVGCHELQGYFFSRPIPVDRMDAFLTAAGHELPAMGDASEAAKAA